MSKPIAYGGPYRVWAEIQRSLGVNGNDLSMFQTIEFQHANKMWTAEVRGIFENHAEVRLASGAKQNVEFNQIWSIVK